MNDKGKISISVVIIGLVFICAISLGMFSFSSRAADDAIPSPPVLQADGGDTGDAPSATEEEGSETTDEEEASEEAESETKEAADITAADVTAPPPAEDEEAKEDVSHRDQTPRELSALGIYYKDDEGSPVAERTLLIRDVNLPTAMERKNDEARSYQTLNIEGRDDPLYITDLIPDALRPELEGEGISGAVDSGLIDQLIQTQISTFFKYIPINIIGTMQNGPYKSALISIPTLGYYGIMKEGQGFQIPAFPGEKGYYIINMTVRGISEDAVTINLNATLVDYVYRRVLASTPTVTRHFYIRRYQ